ncbi:MAG: hypothetical protein OEW78_04410 [Nitrosopumilus sp.]|uniref:hypothetical protein n=1 Tax=Nitrosopumilus sp. TaxID=2024843 RepID=UPI002469E8DB|nr:hypothetical protein [Nitrosopumilus sp.]MDH5431109.1 hypothetical protein [Nitrosopumilus sp.]
MNSSSIFNSVTQNMKKIKMGNFNHVGSVFLLVVSICGITFFESSFGSENNNVNEKTSELYHFTIDGEPQIIQNKMDFSPGVISTIFIIPISYQSNQVNATVYVYPTITSLDDESQKFPLETQVLKFTEEEPSAYLRIAPSLSPGNYEIEIDIRSYNKNYLHVSFLKQSFPFSITVNDDLFTDDYGNLKYALPSNHASFTLMSEDDSICDHYHVSNKGKIKFERQAGEWKETFDSQYDLGFENVVIDCLKNNKLILTILPFMPQNNFNPSFFFLAYANLSQNPEPNLGFHIFVNQSDHQCRSTMICIPIDDDGDVFWNLWGWISYLIAPIAGVISIYVLFNNKFKLKDYGHSIEDKDRMKSKVKGGLKVDS